ncbi:MAG: hypothetical protein C0594_05315 [Marinilabiliales bacterium]|nr:MAG: hypothetical protein C0594_05315 [Marinilabiliales bacterium]
MVSFNSFSKELPKNDLVKQTIEKTITYPRYAQELNEQGIVAVDFFINDAGNIIINRIDGNNDYLSQYVEATLQGLKFNEAATCQSSYIYKFRFTK